MIPVESIQAIEALLASPSGTTIDQFRKAVRSAPQALDLHKLFCAHDRVEFSERTLAVYRHHMAATYAQTRHKQLVDAGFAYWVYSVGVGLDEPEAHQAFDKLVLPSNHEFWEHCFPPNAWDCGCYVSGARTLEGAVRLNGNPALTLPANWKERIHPSFSRGTAPSIADCIATFWHNDDR